MSLIINKSVNQSRVKESFVSHGKGSTYKDGIIEIAKLRDVTASEVGKLGNEQIGISNLENRDTDQPTSEPKMLKGILFHQALTVTATALF